MPQFTPEMVHAYLDAEIDRVRKTGLDVDACLVAPDETAEAEVEAALNAKSYGCVVIGAGLREPPEHLLLFERILNLAWACPRRKDRFQHHARGYDRSRPAMAGLTS